MRITLNAALPAALEIIQASELQVRSWCAANPSGTCAGAAAPSRSAAAAGPRSEPAPAWCTALCWVMRRRLQLRASVRRSGAGQPQAQAVSWRPAVSRLPHPARPWNRPCHRGGANALWCAATIQFRASVRSREAEGAKGRGLAAQGALQEERGRHRRLHLRHAVPAPRGRRGGHPAGLWGAGGRHKVHQPRCLPPHQLQSEGGRAAARCCRPDACARHPFCAHAQRRPAAHLRAASSSTTLPSAAAPARKDQARTSRRRLEKVPVPLPHQALKAA